MDLAASDGFAPDISVAHLPEENTTHNEGRVAVFLEFVNVIVQKVAVARHFPGGLDGFAQQAHNLTEDEHLFRVGFMSTNDALLFVEQLEAAGLQRLGEANSPIAIVQQGKTQVPWLTIGELEGYDETCWLSGYPPGALSLPEPGFLMQCDVAGPEWMKPLEQCGATLIETEDPDYWRCIRAEAELRLFVARRAEDTVFCAERLPSRRLQFQADVQLIRDLEETLQKQKT